ncbi:hypothetical protein Kfla_1059 [Kribbella flavida DSM 17836]|uniref:Secreted protein n=1 Tax=Kribbella flavida (strain DSM 17836 / JCM 10339 / NBRC 14399) TaxID=479435 RepID=D2Q1H5_KRIFD|nr:hypothetical protein [Kribbella flavida]ADB30163.1 hypothetical protein Kfla_1059 [Kribbella flavida DSM 17836]
MSRAVVVRLGAFAGVLALAFAGTFALGSAIDPIAAADPAQETPGMAGMEQPAAGHGEGHGDAAGQPPGLAVSQSGYTLVPATTFFQSSQQTALRFTIQGPDGKPVTQYTKTHEKDLHLIVVRRDLSGFHHLHPTMDATGTWSIPFTFTAGGTWRLYADFQPAALDETLTLGTDVNVSGLYIPVPLNDPASATTVDGYDVTLAGTPQAGKESELTFAVSKDGKPVTDLQPYLGAFGHLVSLRSGDLAYLHNHPAEHADAGTKGGPQITFGTTFPTAGTYSLYLDFQHAGAVRTAEFTVRVGTDGTAIVPPTPQPSHPGKSSSPGHGETPHGH